MLYLENIPELREHVYQNLFITCTHIDINKEKGDSSKPSVQDIETDGFSWEENERRAYDC